jgi:hypothetical protein
MNVHWMVLYKLYVFCSDIKLKMAATAGLSLTLDRMGEMFQNASSLKPLGQLKPNCPGMIIGRSSIGPSNHIEYPTETKNFVEDHPRNIPAKFGSNRPSGFGEEA